MRGEKYTKTSKKRQGIPGFSVILPMSYRRFPAGHKTSRKNIRAASSNVSKTRKNTMNNLLNTYKIAWTSLWEVLWYKQSNMERRLDWWECWACWIPAMWMTWSFRAMHGTAVTGKRGPRMEAAPRRRGLFSFCQELRERAGGACLQIKNWLWADHRRHLERCQGKQRRKITKKVKKPVDFLRRIW